MSAALHAFSATAARRWRSRAALDGDLARACRVYDETLRQDQHLAALH